MNRIISRAAPADTDVLVELMGAFYAESAIAFDEARSRSMFLEMLGDDRLGGVWLCREGERPIGYVAITFTFSLEYGGQTAFVEDIYVRPSHRGLGIGTELLGFAEREMHRRACHAAHLEVGRTNEGAIRLYERIGFEATDRLLLTKRLRPESPSKPPGGS